MCRNVQFTFYPSYNGLSVLPTCQHLWLTIVSHGRRWSASSQWYVSVQWWPVPCSLQSPGSPGSLLDVQSPPLSYCCLCTLSEINTTKFQVKYPKCITIVTIHLQHQPKLKFVYSAFFGFGSGIKVTCLAVSTGTSQMSSSEEVAHFLFPTLQPQNETSPSMDELVSWLVRVPLLEALVTLKLERENIKLK